MKNYHFNYHAEYATHVGEIWAASRYDVEKMILSVHSNATNIDIWVD